MIDRSLARRYVAALYRLAAETGVVDQVAAELAAVEAGVNADPRMQAILKHPRISVDEKRELLLRLAGPSPSEALRGFLSVVLEKERTEVLGVAAETFVRLADEERGVVRAQVEVAWEPSEEQRDRLSAALSRLEGAPVELEVRLNPEVIAGARVHVGGRVLDGSAAGRLNQLVQSIQSAAISISAQGAVGPEAAS